MMNGNGVWKSAAVGLGTGLLTVLGTFYTMGFATERYVEQYVNGQSPYLREREFILQTISRSEANSETWTTAIQENTKAIIRLQVTLEHRTQSNEH